MVEQSQWMAKVEADPNHSSWYIERFRTMAAEGKDLAGEARFIHTLVPPKSRILDAGCGPGRIGGHLAEAGHTVIGVDVDPTLIAAAEEDHPGPTWFVSDLAEFDLAAHGITEKFDAIVCAGNVATFLAPRTRVEVLTRLGRCLTDEGRLAVGFGLGRDYAVDDFRANINEAGLTIELELESWDIRPFTAESGFIVALISK
ncbi:MAG: class I SAM-dependent methyltransferase [Acidimicrobiales bacterium]|nr:class I SAM-dependent methyltransferase [Acidimicrobiales bacterium]